MNRILQSKYNKPFPVTLLPSAITFYLTERQYERHKELVAEIRALRPVGPAGAAPAAKQ